MKHNDHYSKEFEFGMKIKHVNKTNNDKPSLTEDAAVIF